MKLRADLLDNPRLKWSSMLQTSTENYNRTPHEATGFSPYFLAFGATSPGEANPPPLEAHKMAALIT